ncbi:transmembrane O-methyltransferase homolog [Phaenicophaeus curvirostris]|uniref:transmembrane O-methyltransferase homolog n=1 Tax=Phaenicophaeus curvirostris TaxID=33595 RepID=UPI0037F0A798
MVPLALALVPLALTLLLRYRHHVALLWRAGPARWLRDRLSGLRPEERALRFLLQHALPGDPDHVLGTLDRWGLQREHLPCLGPQKGGIVERLVRARGPRWALQLGAGSGYEAVLLARSLPPGARLLALEPDPRRAEVARAVLRLAGFHPPAVQVLQGRAAALLPGLRARGRLPPAELVLLAHGERRFLRLLLLLERQRLLAPGATVLAHHVLFPGAPRLLQYVRSCPRYRCRLHRAALEFCPGVPDGVADIRFAGYA